MTMRGFLASYLATVMVVGAVGATTYHGLQRQNRAAEAVTAADKPVAVTEVTPQTVPQVVAQQSPAAAPPVLTAPLPPADLAHANRAPKLRPHVTVATRMLLRHPPRTAAVEHAPVHRPTVVASMRHEMPEMPVYRPAPYAAPPRLSPPAVGYYAYPVYQPYAGYYPYYPRYGYYRSF